MDGLLEDQNMECENNIFIKYICMIISPLGGMVDTADLKSVSYIEPMGSNPVVGIFFRA